MAGDGSSSPAHHGGIGLGLLGTRRVAVVSLILGLSGPPFAHADSSLAPHAVTDTLPRGPSVSQENWADRLVGALGLASAAGPDAPPTALFALLCPPTTAGDAPPISASIPSSASSAKVSVSVTVPEAGVYALAVQGQGSQRWRAGNQDAGAVDPQFERPGFAPQLLPLPAGPQMLSGSFDPGSRATRVTLERYVNVCIQPRDGWAAGQPLRFGDKARTLVRALGLEARLPTEGPPQTIAAETFHAAAGQASVTDAPLSAPASGHAWVRANRDGAELRWEVQIDDPGVVTLLARLHGAAPQIWTIGSSGPRAVRPGAGASGWVWTEIATLPLGAGVQTFRAQLPEGAGVDVLRVLRRRDGDQDYLAVLDAMGLEEGAADQPVDSSAASANLANPIVRTLVAGFFERLAAPVADDLMLIEHEQQQLYTRPLSPLLPAEM